MEATTSSDTGTAPKRRKIAHIPPQHVSCKHSFLWVIEDIIDSSPEGDLCTYSCEFKMESTKSKWCISLNAGSCMSFGVKVVECPEDLVTSISVCLLDTNLKKQNKVTESKLFQTKTGNLLEFPFFLKEDDLKANKNYLHNNDLILFGEISVLSNEIRRRDSEIPVYSNFSANMEELLNQHTYADFKIVVKGKEFLCHKAILASRSQFFDALLRNNMKEKSEGVLALGDIEPDVFQLVLKYIYTNEIDITLTNVVSVLTAADKYLLSELKFRCEEKLQKCFSLRNLCNILSIAETFCLHDLKCTALRSWAMFTKQLEANIDFHYSPDQESFGQKGSEQKVYTISPNSMTVPIQKLCVEQSYFPPANVWVSTKKYVVFCDRWRISGFLDHVECKEAPMVYSFTDENLGISCNVKVIITKEYFARCGYWAYATKLCFELVSCKEESVCMKLCFSLEDVTGSKPYIQTCFKNLIAGQTVEILRIPKIDDGENRNLLHDGDLIVNCKCWIVNCSVHCQEYPLPKTDLTVDISSMLTDAKFSDLVISVKGTSFPCHKAIVACRSPFLAKMIKKHSKDAVVELKNIEPDEFKKILNYIYTDKYECMETVAWDLLPLTLLYELEHLKNMCERILVYRLNCENALDTLRYSIKHSAHTLQDHTLRFIKKYFIRVLEIPQCINQIEQYGLAHVIMGAITDHSLVVT